MGIYRDSGASSSANRHKMSFTSTMSEEKENGELSYARSKLSPELRYASGSGPSSGRDSPARGFRRAVTPTCDNMESNAPMARERPVSSLPQPSSRVESWTRAAEVTSQLKARIEQMKVRNMSCVLHHLGLCLTCSRRNKRLRALEWTIDGQRV